MVVGLINQFNFVLMSKSILCLLLFVSTSLGFAQESLLLGELKAEDIRFTPRTDGAEKITSYFFKVSKKEGYNASDIVGFEQYYENGLIRSKVSFNGKNKQNSNSFNYEYDGFNMVRFSFLSISDNGNYGRQGEFTYDEFNRLVLQKHSLANIRYEYYPDGRMKTKAYYYDNKGESETEPWINYYFYDNQLNLIHVDPDPKSTSQTSFYNDKNELIKHDYYPGIAYSTYAYDSVGNCIQQVDYEMGKKHWDSTKFLFTYNERGQLVTSGQMNKKGKIFLDEEHKYLPNGEPKEIIYFRKNKAKFVKHFNYEYFEE